MGVLFISKSPMNHSHATYKTNMDSEDAVKNAREHVLLVDKAIELCQANLVEYKKKRDSLDGEIKRIHAEIISSHDSVLDSILPTLQDIFKDLHLQVTLQRQENDKLQQQIIELKKERGELQQFIISCCKKVAELESDLGNYLGK